MRRCGFIPGDPGAVCDGSRAGAMQVGYTFYNSIGPDFARFLPDLAILQTKEGHVFYLQLVLFCRVLGEGSLESIVFFDALLVPF